MKRSTRSAGHSARAHTRTLVQGFLLAIGFLGAALLAGALGTLYVPPGSLWWQLGCAADGGRAGNLTGPLRYSWSLRRAAAAVALEQRTDAEPGLGACSQGRALLPALAQAACERLECLHSAALGRGVDLEAWPLALAAGKCPAPRGGQGPVAPGELPQVSFVLTFRDGAAVAAQSLLELFRAGGEAASAEYIAVDDGSSDSTEPLAQVRGQAVLLQPSQPGRGLAAAAAQQPASARPPGAADAVAPGAAVWGAHTAQAAGLAGGRRTGGGGGRPPGARPLPGRRGERRVSARPCPAGGSLADLIRGRRCSQCCAALCFLLP